VAEYADRFIYDDAIFVFVQYLQVDIGDLLKLADVVVDDNLVAFTQLIASSTTF
jgi:hypothetical protein